MQAQGDVGVLGGVVGGAVDRDLVEADLLGALAADIRIGDRREAQVALGERVHVVRAVGFQHVGLQQGVVGDAAQGDAVVGEHVGVVLEVLAELGVLVRLQPGAELLQHLGQGQLRRHVRTAVRQRQVGGLARLDRERHPDQLRRHRVEAGGLGVEGGERGGGDLRQPDVEGGPVEDGEIVRGQVFHLLIRGHRGRSPWSGGPGNRALSPNSFPCRSGGSRERASIPC